MPTTKVINEQNIEIECIENECKFNLISAYPSSLPQSLDYFRLLFFKAERQRMKDYWVKHSVQASIQEMLLDSNAEEISDNEMPEIISILPSFKSKVILELGAGIGLVFFHTFNLILTIFNL